ncbi:MAG TPA: sigma-70 family RNA polymerase sigma factor [Planctomycetota bacterium]
MRIPLPPELSTHATAMRALARMLVGEQHADDLVQDTALQALLRSPDQPTGLRGWLMQVLRHRAGKHWRSEGRRRAREANTPRPEPEITPAQLVEQREAVQQLHAALMSCPEPYLGTLLLRFFEDLTPTVIAEKTGTPLPTVKSRLQRGLALLRERLDREHPGSSWRAAFAAAFHLDRTLPPASAAAVTAGVLLMGTGVKLALGGLAAALVATWFVFSREGAPPVTPAGASRGSESGVVAESVVRRSADTAEDSERREVTPAESAPGDAALARFSGRCVDEAGRPLAGVRVKATGFVQGDANLPRWPQPPDQFTGVDGCFTLRCALPERFMVKLDLELAGRCPCTGSFDGGKQLEHDVGDLVLWPAIAVQGRVVDARGQPVAGVELELKRFTMGQPRTVGPKTEARVTTDANGAFGPVTTLPPGRGSVKARNRVLRGESIAFELSIAQPRIDLELVVVDDDELPSIEGVVVDADGNPIANAIVYMQTIESKTSTGPEGEFCVRRATASQGQGPFYLAVRATGFERADSGPHALGAKGVRIVMQPANELRIRARDPEGRPIETFGFLLGPVAGGQLLRASPVRLRPEGLARVSDLPREELDVVVVPGPQFACTRARVTRGTGDVVVQCAALEQRTLRVVGGNGAPVGGVDVELLDAEPGKVDLDTYAIDLTGDQPVLLGASGVPRLQRGQTDQNGELHLSGPGDRALVLRLRGGGVALQVTRAIRLDEAGVFVVTAAPGASWTGRLVPEDAAARLATFAHTRPNEQRREDALGLSLARGSETVCGGLVYDPLLPIDAGGRFRFDGLPAGTWTATVVVRGSRCQVGTITVAEGQQLERDLDVAPLRPSRVELQVLVDGAPLVESGVNVLGTHPLLGVGPPARSGNMLATDARGRLVFESLAGTLALHVYVPEDSGGARVVWAPDVAVPLGADVRQTIDLRLVATTLRLKTPAGTPACKVPLALVGPFRIASQKGQVDGWNRVGETNDAGAFTMPKLAAGPYTVLARRSLTEDAWLEVGAITVVAGPAQTFDLTLPPAWDR